MMRITLFLVTNFAVLILISIIFMAFGFEGILKSNGVDLDLGALLFMSIVIGFGGAFISLALSKWSAKKLMGVRILEHSRDADKQWLLDIVHQQARQARIGAPEVGIFESPQPNAFATGMSRNNSLVAVSTGLLDQMTKDEVEAVLAHEMSHIRNGDMVTMGLLQGVLNTFVIFLSRVIGFLIDRIVFKNSRGVGIGYYVTSIIAQIVLSILAQVVVMWFSRRREFRADAGGAELVGKHKMIAALQRLQAAESSAALPSELAAFGIVSRGGLMRLFMTHPSLGARIEALASDDIVVNRHPQRSLFK